MNNQNRTDEVQLRVAKLALTGTIIAAFVSGIALIVSELVGNDQVLIQTPNPTPPSPSLDKYLYNCTDESKKFDENQCKKVLQTLEKEFPKTKINVDNISWKFISPIYHCGNIKELIEAEFKINNETVNAEFSPEGILMEIEYEDKPIDTLPENIEIALKKYLLAKNKYKKPDFYELEIDPNTGKKWYEFEVDNGIDYDVTFDENGNKIEGSQNQCED